MAIHIELDILFFIILLCIAYQSAKNVNQQMNRVLFRYTVYGIMANLLLDILWLALDGQTFPGAAFLNRLANALFLASGIVIGCLWYLYVLETLGYKLTRRLIALVMAPGAVFTVLNLVSIHTGWIFTLDENNYYIRGPLFWLQMAMAVAVLLIPLFHCILRLIDRRAGCPRREVVKLLLFYIVPVVGTLASMPFSGMPGAWSCASVSVILMYIDSQDQEIVRDSLPGLNNRKTIPAVFEDYTRQSGGGRLYLIMMDLNDFKGINDTYGHPVGDQALAAAAKLFLQAVEDRKAMVARVGGDEFLILTFFADDAEALAFKTDIEHRFEAYNHARRLPAQLSVSIGLCAWAPGESTRHGEPENMSMGDRHSICRWRMKSSSCQLSPRTPLPSLPHVPPPTRSATTNG